MAYLVPSEFVTKMVDAGESKIFMSTRDTVIRAYMAGAILFPVGFCMLYLFGFDLLTGVFVLCPLAVIDKRPGCTWGGVLRNWTLVFFGNLAGAEARLLAISTIVSMRIMRRSRPSAMVASLSTFFARRSISPRISNTSFSAASASAIAPISVYSGARRYWRSLDSSK